MISYDNMKSLALRIYYATLLRTELHIKGTNGNTLRISLMLLYTLFSSERRTLMQIKLEREKEVKFLYQIALVAWILLAQTNKKTPGKICKRTLRIPAHQTRKQPLKPPTEILELKLIFQKSYSLSIHFFSTAD